MGGEVTGAGFPTVLSFDVGSTLITLTQNGLTADPANYRAYYSFSLSCTDFTAGFKFTPPGVTEVLFTNSDNGTEQGYYDFSISPSAPNKSLELIFQVPNDSCLLTLNYFFICKRPTFDPLKSHCFQLPMFSVTGENLFQSDDCCIGMQLTDSDTHTGSVTELTTVAPPYFPGVYIKEWDFPYMDYPLGYQGSMFFKYKIDVGKVAWGLDLDSNPRQVTLLFVNRVGGLPGGAGVTHLHNINPITELEGCFKSDAQIGSPITTDDGSIYIGGIAEQDPLTDESKVDVELENIYTEVYLMKTELQFVPLNDNEFFRLKFQLNNTSSVIVTFQDSTGGIIYSEIATQLNFDRIINVGVLPPDKTVTVIFDFFDVLNCEADDFASQMICEVSLEQFDVWLAWTETFQPTFGVFQDYLTESHATYNATVGESYDPYVFYCIDTTTLLPDCYKVRIFGNSIGAQYVSQCLKICDATVDLCYISWAHKNIKCIGNTILDTRNYGKGYEEHFWIRCDLQDLIIEEERNIYRRSDGFSVIAYVEQFRVYTLQLWKMPEYVRRAFSVATIDTFSINGIEYQVLNSDGMSPQFNQNPNSAIRINVRRVGDFVLSKNNLPSNVKSC